MTHTIKTAILEFLGNEFKLDPASISPDTSFLIDFNLTPQQVIDLLNRLQEALDVVLPEEKIEAIETVSDLFAIVEPESEDTDDPHL